jgi:biopolymer transport protein ExbB/TolQ
MARKKSAYLILTVVLFGFITNANAGAFFHQQPQAQQMQSEIETVPASQDSTQKSGQSKITTFWELYQQGGYIAYVIMGVLVIGIFTLVVKAVELFIDWRNSRHLVKQPFRDLEQIKDSLASSKSSYLKGMLQHLITFFEAGYSAANTQYELSVFKHVKYEKFETYQGWLFFLSDSAGALGLLGTVWGVFQTFFGGNLDNEKILDGMGMALITTFFGLIVSLIINFGNTKIFGSFNKRMEVVAEKGDKLRLFLMDWESMKRQAKLRQSAALPAGAVDSVNRGSEMEKLIENIGMRISRSIEKSISGNPAVLSGSAENGAGKGLTAILVKKPPSQITTGEVLPKAMTVDVVDENRLPVQKTKVVFQTVGDLYVEKKQRKVEKVTDRNGHVKISLLGGEHAGTAELNYWPEKNESAKVRLAINVIPGKAQKIAIQKGNHQSAKVGQKFSDGLQVSVHDQFGNPVSGIDVLFKLLEGEGVFNGGHPNFAIQTDLNGLAETDFNLGQSTGVHRVQAAIQNSRSKPVEFVLFSTSEEV